MKRKSSFRVIWSFVAISICAAHAPADVRFRVRTTEGDRTSETITYLKGVRQRDEFTGVRGRNNQRINTAFVHQCDRKRHVWLDMTNKLYIISAHDFRNNEEALAYYEAQAAQPGSPYARVLERARARSEKLPVTITATTTIVDTGERREMFGYTARHIKTVTSWKASRKESCVFNGARLETDGWYIDLLYGLHCSSDISGNMSSATLVEFSGLPPGRCGERVIKDKYRLQRETLGEARFGFPLTLTKRMQDEKNRVSISTQEVIELSTEELSANLFEVPADYTEVPVERARK